MRVTSDVRFAIIPEWVLFADIAANAVRLYGLLARHADKDTDYAIVGRSRLAEQLRCSPDTVDRALADLVRIQAVTVEHRKSPDHPNRNLPNGYRLHVQPGRSSAATRTDAQGGMGNGAARVGAPVRQEVPKVSNERTTTPEAERLCLVLAELVEANGSKRPTITDRWRTEADKMLRLDGRSVIDAENLIRWCQSDPFWRANILSMPTFRSRYDQLRLKSENGNGHKPMVGSREWAEGVDKRRGR